MFRRGGILALLTMLSLSFWPAEAQAARERSYAGTTEKDKDIYFEVLAYAHRPDLALHSFDVEFGARCEDGSVLWSKGYGISSIPPFSMNGHRIDLHYKRSFHLVGSFWRWRAFGTIRVHFRTPDEDGDRMLCSSGKLDWTARRPEARQLGHDLTRRLP
jgi:hypothetical protein